MNSRIEAVRKLLTTQKLASLLVTNPTNIYYLTDISSPNPQEREVTLLITPEQNIIFASPLLAIKNTQSPKSIPDILKSHSPVGFEPRHLTFFEYNHLKSLTKLVPTTSLIENIRQVKDSTEIKKITQACILTRQTINYLHNLIKPGITEIQLAWEAEQYIREHGAEGLAFPTIIASGPNSAIPHHTTSNRKIQAKDLVLIDCGAKVNGYCGDMTRTFFVGTPTAEQLKVEAIVKSAHQSALKHLGGGRMDSSEVDKIARMTIDKAGYGQYFIHSTGHGLGLDIHESPSLSPQATSSSRAFTLSAVAVKSRGYNLQANMVVTIEPGIYLPGKFGYRHEDTILINKAGYKILTTSY